jgi:hypothetical protein
MSSGPLTFSQLFDYWKSVTDEGYWRPLVEKTDSGVEAVYQGLTQWARVSVSVDRTTQAMFVLTWSGQSDDPASGGVHATVALSVSRTLKFEVPVVLPAGARVLHVDHDYGETGAVEVLTGRAYLLDHPAVLLPGLPGPVLVDATAEREGYGYNLPLADTLTRVEQLGERSAGTGSTVAVVVKALPITLGNENRLSFNSLSIVEQLTSSHIGQYVTMTAGTNAGDLRLVVGYDSSCSPPAALLDTIAVLDGALAGAALQPGEQVTQPAVMPGGGAVGIVLGGDARWLLVECTSGTFEDLGVVTGQTTGNVFNTTVVARDGHMAAEAGTAAWQVLGLEDQLGVTITNPAAPDGGRNALLDEVGGQRGVDRGPGQSDADYRRLIAAHLDKVAPNAIRRAANRILAPIGSSCCLREVGTTLFPGLFYDAGSSADAPQHPEWNFFFDMNCDETDPDRFKVYTSRVNSRGYFLLGVPQFNLDEFGFAYDMTGPGLGNFFDGAYVDNFYDGYPAGNEAAYQAIYDAVWRVHAGGVGFQLYVEHGGCH